MLIFFCFLQIALAKEDDRRHGVQWGGYPVGNYSTDEGFTFGALARRIDYGDKKSEDKKSFNNVLTLEATLATEGRKSFLAEFDQKNVSLFGLPWRSYSLLAGQLHDRASYYGYGDRTIIDSTLANQDFYNFEHNFFTLEQRLRFYWSDEWSVQGGAGFEFHSTQASDITGVASAFGNEFGTGSIDWIYTRILAGIVFENRNSEFVPDEGNRFDFLVNYSPAFLGNLEDSWWKATTSYRQYYPLIEDRWLTAVGQTYYQVSSLSAPFEEKAKLGGDSTLRGFHDDRFRTQDVFGIRGELRSVFLRLRVFDIPLKGGIGVFLDSGWAGDNLGRLFQNGAHLGYGVSFIGSYFTDDFVGHMDLGFSKEGSSISISLGHAI